MTCNAHGVALRPYQEKAVAAILREFDSGKKSTLLVMSTGTGKTVTFGEVAHEFVHNRGQRVLVLAHRGELLEQAQAKLDVMGVDSAVEKAEQRALKELSRPRLGLPAPRCVVASVQSMQGRRLAEWPRDFFGLVITDEAHHATAQSYLNVYAHFEAALHLGVTATPDRFDETSLGEVFESKAFEYTLPEAIRDGYLAPLTLDRADVPIDLRGIRTTGGDFNAGDLEDRIAPKIGLLVNAVRERVGDRQTIVFTPDVKSARMFADALVQVGVSARSVAGEDGDRPQTFRAYANREFQALCNCLDEQTEILTDRGWAGIDDFRSTDSTATYDIQTGRVDWEPVSRVVRRDRAAGERMVCVKNQTLDIRVTEGHRMVVRTCGAKAWQIVEAGTLPGRVSPYQIPLAGEDEANWDICCPDGTTDPSALTLDECRFIGLWLADGTIDRRGGRGVTISQSDVYKEANLEIQGILTSCGFDWKSSDSRSGSAAPGLHHRYRVPKGNIGGQLARKGFRFLEAYLDKDFSFLLEGLDKDQFRAFVQGLWLGDGIKRKNRKHRNGVRRSWEIVNTNKAMLDRLQALAVTRGFAANISKPRENGPLGTKPIYTITVRERAEVATNNVHVETSGGNPARFEEGWKQERVWCVTNRTGTIITRRNGRVTIMGQCQLATEGFDDPATACIVLARPTQSRALLCQMVGRGTRLCEGKADALVIDFAWQVGDKHKLVHPVDILSPPGAGESLLALARRLAQSGFDSLTAAMGRAQEILEGRKRAAEEARARAAEYAEEERFRQEAHRLEVRVKARDTGLRWQTFDPVGATVGRVLAVPDRGESFASKRILATENQVAALVRLRVPREEAEGMSRRQASQHMDVLIARARDGMATVPQVRCLLKNGVPHDEALRYKLDEASRFIDGLKRRTSQASLPF